MGCTVVVADAERPLHVLESAEEVMDKVAWSRSNAHAGRGLFLTVHHRVDGAAEWVRYSAVQTVKPDPEPEPDSDFEPARAGRIVAPASALMFEYINWRGVLHVYVIRPDVVEAQRLTFGKPDPKWYLNGQVVTRDGDPRPEMGDNRRRSFELTKIRKLTEVQL
jgi:hypothetical protein